MKKILCFFFVAIMLFGIFPLATFAKGDTSFDNSDINEDLKGVDIVDLFDLKNVTTGFSFYFLEYSYSQSEKVKDNYGLYVYVYNVGLEKIDVESDKNMIQLATEADENGYPQNYVKYVLSFCSKTDDGLIYKFKIQDADKIYSLVSAESRLYCISGIELLFSGANNAKDIPLARKYTFTGYSKGCLDGSSESTLEVDTEYFDVLSLDKIHTSYRVQGNEIGKYYDIQSVAFNVPKTFKEKYGDIYSIRASWREALTTPILVLDNAEMVKEFEKVLCSRSQARMSAFPYSVFWDCELSIPITNLLPASFSYYNNFCGRYSTGYNSCWQRSDSLIVGEHKTNEYLSFNYCFYSPDVLSADKICVSSSALYDYLTEKGWKDRMFESIGEVKTVELEAGKLNTVEKYSVASWWENLLSLGIIQTEQEADISYTTLEKVDSNDKTLSVSDFAEKYKVGEAEVESIQSLMNDNEITYLFRYTLTDYTAYGNDDIAIVDNSCVYTSLNHPGIFWSSEPIVHGIVAQTTAIMSFDILEMLFVKAGIYTPIGVVSDPTNFVSGVSAPAQIEFPDIAEGSTWRTILIVLIVVLVLVVVFPILKPIFAILWSVIKLPFVAISKLIKKGKR